jgi:uncharacterized protein with GYD domain
LQPRQIDAELPAGAARVGGRPALWISRREDEPMATYVLLAAFTEQGIHNVKDSVKRSEAFKKAAKQAGASVKELLWIQGPYDLVTIIDAPDDATVSALALNVAKLGNIRGQTLRAFTAAEMEKILEKVA